MKKIIILIVDDHKLISETLGDMVNNDPRFKVIGICFTAEAAVQLTKEKEPAVILMDIGMAGLSGLETTWQILLLAPGSRILGLSIHSEPSFAKKMMQLGAKGYVTKNSSKKEMIHANP
jgi:DNA-binding NarL/FixJ family response regulator